MAIGWPVPQQDHLNKDPEKSDLGDNPTKSLATALACASTSLQKCLVGLNNFKSVNNADIRYILALVELTASSAPHVTI
ncbi:hypothetical protein CBOM_06033 [Ceraceosorus bombacis]|uniref:Uncharacterized protein n=1 Tax=Ceraceosorus bombacis TaxID=401625 RepID=A0A0P1BJE0_9BASI|nr:hypothetical protein CBOM_06033 [Ceraceosorus bombacis]